MVLSVAYFKENRQAFGSQTSGEKEPNFDLGNDPGIGILLRL